MADLKVVYGMGRSEINKLLGMGIRTTSALLTKGAMPQNRRDLAQKMGIDAQSVLEWVIWSDFFRIKGMRAEYVQLLQAAGVDALQALGFQKPQELYRHLCNVNDKKRVLEKIPSLAEVERWVKQAQELPPVVWFDGMYCLGIYRGA